MKHRTRKKSAVLAKHRWLAYATAGAATAVGGATSSEAEIHYSGRMRLVLDIKEHGGFSDSRKLPLTGQAHLVFVQSVSLVGDVGVNDLIRWPTLRRTQ